MAPPNYDYIIIGGGTAGLVLAARLSEDENIQVLVLEAGQNQNEDPRVIMPAMWPTLLNTTSNWHFRTTPQDGLQGRDLAFPQGRVIGGSSAINGLTFTPPSKTNVEAWAALGNPGWDWASYSGSLSKAFTLFSPTAEVVTGNGPLSVSLPDTSDMSWPESWMSTLKALGHTPDDDIFSGKAFGSFTNPDSIQPTTRQRSHAGSAYLGPASARPNLTVITGAMVRRVLLENEPAGVVAKGVEYAKDGETVTIEARTEVIVSAGPINSPRILEQSGIGSSKLLGELGIPVLVDNPHVGENLQNHVICGMCYEVQDGEGTIDGLARQDPAALGAAMEAYGRQSGPFARSGTNAAAQLPVPGFATAEGKQDVEGLLKLLDSQVDETVTPAFAKAHADYLRTVLTTEGEASGYYMSLPGFAWFKPDGTMSTPPDGSEGYFTIALILSNPLSHGSVHISSASLSGEEKNVSVEPRFLSHPVDVEILARHLMYLETIVRTEPLASHLKKDGKRSPMAPEPGGFENLEQAKDYVRKTAIGAHHWVGSCSMMPKELGGVVDSELRVHGCRNLRVCDSSIIPITPRGNTQATVYGVAEHGASIIKASKQTA